MEDDRMTVGQLKELIKDVPDDMFVYFGEDEMPLVQVTVVEELTFDREKYLHLKGI